LFVSGHQDSKCKVHALDLKRPNLNKLERVDKKMAVLEQRYFEERTVGRRQEDWTVRDRITNVNPPIPVCWMKRLG
jgi:hypothetical protein